jgi:hypothetical protein
MLRPALLSIVAVRRPHVGRRNRHWAHESSAPLNGVIGQVVTPAVILLEAVGVSRLEGASGGGVSVSYGWRRAWATPSLSACAISRLNPSRNSFAWTAGVAEK